MRWLILVAFAPAACFKADVANCAASCASSADCPGGLVCTAAGLCAESASTTCSGSPDAALDAAPDGAPGMIRITVRDDRGLPATGVRVLAATADGTPVVDTTTSTNGVAMVLAPGPVDLTIVRTPSLGARLSTILGAVPGDDLLFGPERNEPPSVVHQITWPSNDDGPLYQVYSSCATPGVQLTNELGNTTETAPITVDPTCADDHDVLVALVTGTTDDAYLIALNQPDDDVVITSAWVFMTVNRTNLQQLPADVPAGNISVTSGNVFRDGEPARGWFTLGTAVGGGGGGTVDLRMPPIGAAREMATIVQRPADPMCTQQIVERIAPQGEYNVSVEPSMLPWLLSAPVFDTTNRRVRWTQGTAGPTSTAGDMIAAELAYNRGATTYTWRVFAPVSAATPTANPGEVELRLPDLPGSEPFELRSTDTANRAWLRVYGFQDGFGYDGARVRADAAIAGYSDFLRSTDTYFADPGVTRVVTSQYGL
jgi:hypothetical protein